MKYTAEEYKKALEIATVCLQAAGVCRYENPWSGCRMVLHTDADCWDCIKKWLLDKARKEIKEHAED